MSVSEAQKRATLKWQKEKTDEIRFRVPKGERARIQAHAEQHGESATALSSAPFERLWSGIMLQSK